MTLLPTFAREMRPPLRLAALRAALTEAAFWRAMPAVLCIAALCVLASPYIGISGDARIYIGRAMADLDPEGLGRDVMFAQDGQSGFSVFHLFAVHLVGWFGPGRTAIGLAIVNMLAWFSAIALLSSLFARGRARGVLVVCAAVLPSSYAFYPIWSARETIATPRPLSEAFVLIALAAVGRGYTILPLVLVGLAASIHPIMALPGVAVVLILLGLRDRRWFVVVAILVVAVAMAAMAGVPVVARLILAVDPDWRAMLEDRNANLFVSSWPLVSLAPLTVQVATALTGALLCEGLPRRMLVAAVGVGVAGAAASWVLGDCLSLLLVLQAQPWRALWLVSVLAMPAFGLCIVQLPRRGPFGGIALALLALAWLTFDVAFAPVAALLALVLVWRPPLPSVTRSFVLAVHAILALSALAYFGRLIPAAVTYMGGLPGEATIMMPLWQVGIVPLLALLLVAAWARGVAERREPGLALLLLALVTSTAVVAWDQRSLAMRHFEAQPRDPALTSLLASKPGEVLWLGNDDEWVRLGRPQWSGMTQGAAAVFSRPLAMQWRDRTAFLVALGVLDEDRVHPWKAVPKFIVPTLTASAVAAICGRPDAPTWIVAPLPDGRDLPSGVAATRWRAPTMESIAGLIDEKPVWVSFDTYAVVPCTGRQSARR